MKATFIAIFAMAAAIFCASMARSEVAQNAAFWGQRQRNSASETGTEFWILGNAKFLALQWHARKIAILVRPEEFAIENLKAVFLHLSEEYPAEDFLEIDAFSNEEQAESAAFWFAEIQSFPFGNVVPPRCGSGLPSFPLTATYWRTDGSERFVYYPARLTDEPTSVELKRSPDDCAPSGDSATDLVEASRRGCKEVVRELLTGGANPNVKSRHGGAALVEASFWGPEQLGIVNLLLDAGADINQTSSSGWTPLIAAAALGNRPNLVDLLLSRGADVNLKSEEGRTALVYAVGHGNKAVIKNLVAHGADVNLEDGYVKTPLMIAQEANNETLIRLLRKAGARR